MSLGYHLLTVAKSGLFFDVHVSLRLSCTSHFVSKSCCFFFFYINALSKGGKHIYILSAPQNFFNCTAVFLLVKFERGTEEE